MIFALFSSEIERNIKGSDPEYNAKFEYAVSTINFLVLTLQRMYNLIRYPYSW